MLQGRYHFVDRLVEYGVNPMWREVAHRYEHERPQVHARMWQNEAGSGSIDYDRIHRYQVDVDLSVDVVALVDAVRSGSDRSMNLQQAVE